MSPTGHVNRNTKFLFLDDNMKFLENSDLILSLYNWNCSGDFGESTLSYSSWLMAQEICSRKNTLAFNFQSLTFSQIIL